jgi:hypothetical protein
VEVAGNLSTIRAIASGKNVVMTMRGKPCRRGTAAGDECMVVRSSVVSWIAVGLIASAVSASAEIVKVKVVGDKVAVLSRPSRDASVMARPAADTVLEVLSKEGTWLWVLLGRDNHGTQKVGWIRETNVEFVEGGERFYPRTETAPAVADAVQEEALLEVSAEPEKSAKAEKPPKPVKPKKVDDRKLRRAEADLERAREAYERLVPRVQAEPGISLVGQPIVEPLFEVPLG